MLQSVHVLGPSILSAEKICRAFKEGIPHFVDQCSHQSVAVGFNNYFETWQKLWGQ